MAKISKPSPKQEQIIYCGPNIPGGILQQYTVYKGSLPSYLNELFEKCPAIKRLFVPIEEFAKAEIAIKTKGTPEHSAFQEVLQFTLKGGV